MNRRFRLIPGALALAALLAPASAGASGSRDLQRAAGFKVNPRMKADLDAAAAAAPARSNP